MIAVGFLKDKKAIVLTQSVQLIIMSVGNILLGGITGAMVNGVCVVRNLLSLRVKFDTKWKLGFIAAQGILTAIANTVGLIGWLPFVAGCFFTLCLDTKNGKLLKAAIILGQVAWTIYDFHFMNYSAFVFDLLAIISNLIGVFMLIKQEKAANS
jgi:hypothetical protein